MEKKVKNTQMDKYLGDFRIINSFISQQGANANVYKVKHKTLEYVRAMKVLRDIILDENDKKYRNFLNECKILLRLGNGSCPYIVHIAQPRLLEKLAMVEMEYINGEDLQNFIIKTCSGFVPISEVLNFILNISTALAYCHFDVYKFCIDRDDDTCVLDDDDGNPLISPECEKILVDKYKVIHNDIHSKNVMRKYDGSYILLDFGLAFDGDNVEKKSNNKEGALEYKAPEKWDNENKITEQSDIYSFGILMYEMLAGCVPFPLINNSPKDQSDLQTNHLKNKPPTIENQRKIAFEKNNKQKWQKDYPEWLEEMIFKCLEKKPENRFKNAKELNTFLINKQKNENLNVKQKNKNEEIKKDLEFNAIIANTQYNSDVSIDNLKRLEVNENNELKYKIIKLEIENNAKLRRITSEKSTLRIIVFFLSILFFAGAIYGFNLLKQKNDMIDQKNNSIKNIISQQKSTNKNIISQQNDSIKRIIAKKNSIIIRQNDSIKNIIMQHNIITSLKNDSIKNIISQKNYTISQQKNIISQQKSVILNNSNIISQNNNIIFQQKNIISQNLDSIKKYKNKPPVTIIRYEEPLSYKKPTVERYFPYGKGNGYLTIYSVDSKIGTVSVYIDGKKVGSIKDYYDPNTIFRCDIRMGFQKIVPIGKHQIVVKSFFHKWEINVNVTESECIPISLTLNKKS